MVDTFARAYRALLRLEPDGSLRPWLYRVAVNLSYDRKPRKGLAFSSFEESPAERFATDERSPAMLAEQAELRSAVLAAVDALGPKHRTVVVLHYLNELSLAEIADVVDCPLGTVKSRLHYALRQLRVRLRAAGALGSEPWGPAGATGSRMDVLRRAVPR